MPTPAIRVENLGKRYRIIGGETRPAQRTFREMLVDSVASPIRKLRSGGLALSAPLEEFWALKDVSFEVQPGEVVGIIGRNGAGKSTLLKILSRITKPTAGRIEINGRVGSLLEVGTGFHPELTGRENIYLNGTILGMSRREIDRHFDEIVDFSGVEKFLDTPVKRYSSGMYVRLAFAVAAHLQPEILIIDEVLAVGDMAFRNKCFSKIESTRSSGSTILLVSHHLEQLRPLCENAILLEQGRLVSFDSIDDIIDMYVCGAGGSGKIFNLVEGVEIVSAKLLREINRYSIDDSIEIELEYQSAIGDTVLYASVHIQSLAGMDILFSRSIEDSSIRIGCNGKIGQSNKFRIAIPPRALAPGAYNVIFTLNALSPFQQLGKIECENMFEVTDSQDMKNKRVGPWRGLTAVPVAWHTTY